MLLAPTAGLTPLASALASLLTTALAALSPAAATAPPGPVAGADTPAAPATALAALSSPWVPPVDGLVLVLAPFDPPAEDWLPGHRGVDLAAPPGTTVRSAGRGLVAFAGPVAGRDVVVVLHDDGRRTTYEPVTPSVAPGDDVEAGDPIGVVADGGDHCAALCLHWGLRVGDAYLDPMSLLRDGRPVLLPLGP